MQHFQNFKYLVLDFPGIASKAINDSQAVVENRKLTNNFAFNRSLKNVSLTIKFLEKHQIPLVESVQKMIGLIMQ